MDATDPDLELARALAERVIHRLGPRAPALRIRRVERTEYDLIEIELSAKVPGASRMTAVLTTTAPLADAVMITASQLQVHVLELTRGEPLPPCPGHPHPLDTAVVEGIACWVCPRNHEHHVEPILPGRGRDARREDTGRRPVTW